MKKIAFAEDRSAEQILESKVDAVKFYVDEQEKEVHRMREFVENLNPDDFVRDWIDDEEYPEDELEEEYIEDQDEPMEYIEEEIIEDDPESVLRSGREILKKGQDMLLKQKDIIEIELHPVLDAKLTLGSGETVTQQYMAPTATFYEPSPERIVEKTARADTEKPSVHQDLIGHEKLHEETIRKAILENVDDAMGLASHVDEIEIVIREGDFSNDELIEDIESPDDFDEVEWESDLSDEEEQISDISDVDDTDLMKRLDAKYGKIDN